MSDQWWGCYREQWGIVHEGLTRQRMCGNMMTVGSGKPNH